MRKVGSEVPTSTKTVLSRSANPPLNRAARIPSPTPRTSHMNSAPIASERVTGRASPIKLVTHACCWNEYPSEGAGQLIRAAPSPNVRPKNSPLRKRKYCVKKGKS